MEYAGGCQCGRVRYRATGPRDRASVCWCRMCQKAAGAPFMAFVRFPAAQVEWSSPPATFVSSSIAERGFCRECGTPLTYRVLDSPNVSLTIGSLDDPAAVAPEMQFVPEMRLAWCDGLSSLPEHHADDAPPIVNYQQGR